MGLSLAKGEYIWFVDADDYIEENSLNKLNKFLIRKIISILGFNNYHLKSLDVKLNFINTFTGVLPIEDFIAKGFVIECAPWISVFNPFFLRKII